jgi:hypothetical protein
VGNRSSFSNLAAGGSSRANPDAAELVDKGNSGVDAEQKRPPR